jgi:hypothetical protein
MAMNNNRMTFDQLVEHQRRAPQRKRPDDEEHRIQAACVNWFRLQYPTHASALFAVPNGGRRDRVSGAKLKAEGVLPGVSDLILLVARRGCYGLLIEMKTSKGKQSPAQKEWARDMAARGYLYIVCHSFDEFRQAIDDYLLL